MSYKGIRITSNKSYIFEDIEPYDPEIDIERLENIQLKLERYIAKETEEGISLHEAEIFLDWVTYNARNYAVKNTPETPLTATMSGLCAPTQYLNVQLFKKLKINAQPFNMEDGVGEVHINNENLRRIQAGWSSPKVRHSVSMVELPIMDIDGNIQNQKFLLDPTFRQFFLKNNCQENRFFNKPVGKVAPDVGYFMQTDNLVKLGVDTQTAINTEILAKNIIEKGYFPLTEENAKIYGDSFVRASQDFEFQTLPINKTGEDYIKNFESFPMRLLVRNDIDEYLKLPREQREQKNSVFEKVKSIFKKIFNKEQTKVLDKGYNMPEDKLKIYDIDPKIIQTPVESQKGNNLLKEDKKEIGNETEL